MINRKYIVIGIGLYIASALISYFVFSAVSSKSAGSTTTVTSPLPKDTSGKTAFDDSLPKTEACPLTGQLFSKQQRDWWEKHRPLGVMIENHEESRPQSGLSGADIVYEAVAEGGITRFLAIFHCQDGGMVGPVRSARTYYLDFISEYGDKPLYVHVGGANVAGPANALGQIGDYGWTGRNDINQFSVGFPTFWRDYERLGKTVATEHTMYSTVEKLWAVAESRKLTNVDEKGVAWNKKFTPWQVKDDAKEQERGDSSPSLNFWQGYSQYSVKWAYDKLANDYKRENGSKAHTDKDNDKQLVAKNVVVVFMIEKSLNDEEKHMLYTTKGKGKALFFFDGKAVEGIWEKATREARMQFFDSAGKAILFNKGPFWIEVLPIGNTVSY